MRKRILAVMLCCFMAVGVCACGKTTDTVKETKVTEEAETTEEVKASEEEVSESVEIEGKVLKQITYYDYTYFADIYEYENKNITVTNKDLIFYTGGFYLFDDIYYTEVGYEQLGITDMEKDLGTLSKSSYYGWGKLEDSVEYTYDEVGNLLTEAEYGEGGIESSVEYEYDSKGNLSKETHYTGSENQVNYWYTYSYDGEGNLLEVTYYDTSSTYTEYEYVYDEVGNLIQETDYSSNGNCKEISYDYNTEGKVTKEFIHYESDSDSTESDNDFWHEYEYDSAGNLLKVVEYEGDAVNCSVEYEYDGSGNILEATWCYSDSGTASTKLEYDENGNCLSIIIEDDDSSWKYEYEYDEDGNLIKCIKDNYREYIFEYYSDSNPDVSDESGIQDDNSMIEFALIAYQKYIDGFEIQGCELIYLDEDDIPELVFTRDDYYYVLTYKNYAVLESDWLIIYSYGKMYYRERKGEFMFERTFDTDCESFYFTLVDGNFSQIGGADCYENYNGSITYDVFNNFNVSKATYDSYRASFGTYDKSVDFKYSSVDEAYENFSEVTYETFSTYEAYVTKFELTNNILTVETEDGKSLSYPVSEECKWEETAFEEILSSMTYEEFKTEIESAREIYLRIQELNSPYELYIEIQDGVIVRVYNQHV